MRAARFYGPGDLRIEEVPDPQPGRGDVLVQVECALTDGTDLKTFRRGHPKLVHDLPSPFGHEFCGFDVATGRRVVAANSAPCGSCGPCSRGQETLCDNLLPLLNGAYAELLVVPERIARVNLHPVPRTLASEVAALVEPLACALHAVELVEPGQTVAVLGPGPMGLLLCACLRDAGAEVVVAGGSPSRRELAQSFGATPGDAQDADVVVEATGKPKGWRDAVHAVRKGGTVVLFSGVQGNVELDSNRLHYDELVVRGAFHHTPRTVRAALAYLASGAYPWDRLLTHEVSLEQLPGLFAEPPPGYLKAIVRP
ncbi:MAG TPA: zinc-binding dehydrogenase [Gaiellaceae bacterium]|nr:zinc-binding dehydrogenase [Gaiellaceae bacterium]